MTSISEEIDRAAMAAAVVDCFLCDDDGYRGTVVCDHVDRSEVLARGLAKVRSVLAPKAREA
jgi:hypothetical protein